MLKAEPDKSGLPTGVPSCVLNTTKDGTVHFQYLTTLIAKYFFLNSVEISLKFK